ncbi:ABC transporter permease [Archangium violaceum]|uniref:ABC transporter permease n=1 Tax=Archangium violaceum TaxID=83451 RepID=UPI00193B9503|nr:ABC transporter permease [Archangium violaceum]QRK07280.1 ABC transporter permease [Archangium violaceum]
MNGLNEIAVIWGAECRRTVRSARAVVLLGLYSLISLVVLLVGALLRAWIQQMAEQAGGVLAPSEQMPTLVVVVFYLSILFLPLYVALMGFDQLSGEVGPRSIRYLTVRARRSSVLMGKFLAQTTILLGLVLALDLILCVYAWLSTPGFGFGAFVLNLFRFWVGTMVFSLAFLALTTLCSSFTTTPAVSLVFNFICILLAFCIWLAGLWFGRGEGHPLENIRYLSPMNYCTKLLDPEPLQFGGSALAYVVFALLFLGGAYTALRTRDL